jgi:hypothetical protein
MQKLKNVSGVAFHHLLVYVTKKDKNWARFSLLFAMPP